MVEKPYQTVAASDMQQKLKRDRKVEHDLRDAFEVAMIARQLGVMMERSAMPEG